MFSLYRFVTTLVLLTSAFSYAGSIDIKSFNYTDISKEDMTSIVQNLDSIYGKNIELKFKKSLKYIISSNSGAQAYVDPYTSKNLHVVMQVPYDAEEPEVIATLCHELGHLVSKGRHGNWIRFKNTIATEGQADYFVPSCMKLYISKFKYEPRIVIDQDVFNVCLNNDHQQFTNSECTIILQAFKNIFAEYNETISYDKIYGKKVVITDRSHPDEQCRLDTVKDSVLGKGRNRCWFSPLLPAKPKWRDFKFWRK